MLCVSFLLTVVMWKDHFRLREMVKAEGVRGRHGAVGGGDPVRLHLQPDIPLCQHPDVFFPAQGTSYLGSLVYYLVNFVGHQ